MTQKTYNFVIKLFATGLGTGYSPIFPGTVGSLLGVLLFFLVFKLNIFVSLLILAILFFAGVYSSTEAEKMFGKKDSKQIVIDEVVPCTLFLLFIPFTKWCIISGFIIYRILDILKPFPAYRSQHLPGGWGIMTDDLIVGIYTIVITNVSHFLLKGLLC
jgi:phosphatidylglycerophosphatase A